MDPPASTPQTESPQDRRIHAAHIDINQLKDELQLIKHQIKGLQRYQQRVESHFASIYKTQMSILRT